MKKLLFVVALVCSYAAFAITQHAQTGVGTTAQAPTPTPTSSTTTVGTYRNGTYTGTVADAIYGDVQVKVTISNGNISDVQFLSYPNDRPHSVQLNTRAMPILKAGAISKQNANVDTVSGASETSRAFRESLQSALDQAKA